MSNLDNPVTVRGVLIVAGAIMALLAVLGGCVAVLSAFDFSH